MTTEHPTYEFSRPINATHLQVDETRTETITANEKERAALAARLELSSLEKLTATITLTRMGDNKAVIFVEGRVSASVHQFCVVTHEPVPETVEEDFETTFASEGYVTRWLEEHPDDDLDAPEIIENGYIDIGELAAQYLSLGLNPYPRKEGLEYMDDAEEEKAKDNPFAVLGALKDKN